jgi:hypothetical protein
MEEEPVNRDKLAPPSESPDDLPKYWSDEMDLALENLCCGSSEYAPREDLLEREDPAPPIPPAVPLLLSPPPPPLCMLPKLDTLLEGFAGSLVALSENALCLPKPLLLLLEVALREVPRLPLPPYSE